MPARTGGQYLEGLKSTSRELWLGSERVHDVVAHPSLQAAAHSMARVFDRQFDCAEDCLMADPETAEPINVSHLIPRSREDLWRRHRGLERIAEISVGLMGRTPDYKNVTFAGFAGRWREWAGPGERNARGANNLVAFQKRLRRSDLALTHTIVHPTVDKRRGDVPYPGADVPLHKVGETADSIIVSGARILATAAPFADELAVYPGFPLTAKADGLEPYALSFTVPMDSPGLIFLCRDSYSVHGDAFDHPLSTNFDEQDAFVIFDQVEVPKQNVFIDGDIGVYNTVMGLTWWPNIMQQTTIRALTKLEFAYGLASRMSRAIGDTSDLTMDLMGELLTYVEMTRSGLLLSIEHARDYGDGVFFPDERPLAPLRATLTQWIPRAFEILILIGSHNLIATPSRAMLDDQRLRGLLERYMGGADDLDAESRAAIFRLAWDFCGSALAGRHALYERFYLGSTARNRKTLYWATEGTFSKTPGPVRERGDELVEAMLLLGRASHVGHG